MPRRYKRAELFDTKPFQLECVDTFGFRRDGDLDRGLRQHLLDRLARIRVESHPYCRVILPKLPHQCGQQRCRYAVAAAQIENFLSLFGMPGRVFSF